MTEKEFLNMLIQERVSMILNNRAVKESKIHLIGKTIWCEQSNLSSHCPNESKILFKAILMA